jgi:cold-inducible RNA-binding protein
MHMETKLFVGNLSWDVTENELQDTFAQHGPVSEVKVMMDRDTGKPRGFAFVTMATKEGAEAAIQKLNGTELQGRALTVNEARAREDRPPGGGGGGRGGRGGGGGGGGRDRGGRGGGGGRY